MNIPVTASLAAVFLALTVFCGWRGARGARPVAAPRLIPWRFLMLLTFTGMVAMLVHLVTLLGPGGGSPGK
jgi:hypothetical protein